MHKPILILLIVFGFIIFPEGIFRQEIYKSVDEKGRINVSYSPTSPANEMANRPGQEIYKSVDEKGTINFSDSPISPVITAKRGAAKQDGAEVLKRNEMENEFPEMAGGMTIKLEWSTRKSGGGSYSGGSDGKTSTKTKTTTRKA